MRFRSIRLVAVALAAGSLIAVPLAESATAATPTSCAAAKLTTSVAKSSSTAVMTKCTNPAATGTKGTLVINFKNYATTHKITGKVTWNKTGTTTLAIKTGTATKAQIAACVKAVGKGAGAATSSGTVTGGTGKAKAGIPIGSKFSEVVCYNAKAVVTLFPKSKIVF